MKRACQHPMTVPSPADAACLSSLISAVARGELTSLAQLRCQAEGLLFTVAYRVLCNRADAEEVVAEVMVRVWLHARTFDESKGTGGAWLTRLCANAAIDRLRHAASRHPAKGLELADETGQPESPEWLAERHQLSVAVGQALSRLSDPHRTVLEMVYFQDMSHSEVSVLAQVPLGTVKCWLRRSLGRLRRDLQAADLRGQLHARQQTSA